MKLGLYKTHLNEIEKLLKDSKLFQERNFFPNNDFDPSEYRHKTYVHIWKSLISFNIYDFILTDNSIISFKFSSSSKNVSFSFYECPYQCVNYQEFLEQEGFEDKDYGKMYSEFYENYLDQCQLKESFVTIRYDYDVNSYRQGIHPASHLHIGFNSQIRFGFDKILTPLNFFTLILRQHYTANWKNLLEVSDWIKSYQSYKTKCDTIEKKHWQKLDKLEFFLA